jgi:hypothetical protein
MSHSEARISGSSFLKNAENLVSRQQIVKMKSTTRRFMKSLIIISIFLSSVFSFAASKSFKIQQKEVAINGVVDKEARTFEVKPGETVEIGMALSDAGNPMNAELTVVDDQGQSKDGMLMNVTITEEIDGQKKIVDTMKMHAHSGKTARMANGSTEISLVGTRIQ